MKRRKRGRETLIGCLPQAPNNLAPQPRLGSQPESNWQPSGVQARAQSIEPHQPGQENLNFISF